MINLAADHDTKDSHKTKGGAKGKKRVFGSLKALDLN